MEVDWRRVISQLRSALALGWLNGIVAARRNPLWLLSNIVPPTSFLILMRLYARPDMLLFALIGGLQMTIASNAIGLMGDTVFYKREVKLQDMMVASPMRPVSYMFGLMLSGLFFSIPGIGIFIVLMVYYGLLNWGNLLIYIFASLLSLITLSGLSFTLATFVKEPRFVWPLSGILSFAISVIPPVYYPSTILPDWLAKISMFIPTSVAAAIFHYHSGLIKILPLPEILLWGVLVLEAILFLEVAMHRSRWREV
jgi:ABC-2 type transport system permease protein